MTHLSITVGFNVFTPETYTTLKGLPLLQELILEEYCRKDPVDVYTQELTTHFRSIPMVHLLFLRLAAPSNLVANMCNAPAIPLCATVQLRCRCPGLSSDEVDEEYREDVGDEYRFKGGRKPSAYECCQSLFAWLRAHDSALKRAGLKFGFSKINGFRSSRLDGDTKTPLLFQFWIIQEALIKPQSIGILHSSPRLDIAICPSTNGEDKAHNKAEGWSSYHDHDHRNIEFTEFLTSFPEIIKSLPLSGIGDLHLVDIPRLGLLRRFEHVRTLRVTRCTLSMVFRVLSTRNHRTAPAAARPLESTTVHSPDSSEGPSESVVFPELQAIILDDYHLTEYNLNEISSALQARKERGYAVDQLYFQACKGEALPLVSRLREWCTTVEWNPQDVFF